ncbi:MAG TPA: hypothetical protein PLP65_11165 [Bacteroidales bacterium]|nr:hypothetical protein [Bacteroidales bacterium]
MHTLSLYICFIFLSQFIFAQGELAPEARVVTTNEHSFLFAINSNGSMFSFQHGKRLDGFRKRTVDFDFTYIKHPKEIRVENPYYQSQKKFVFGKLYSMFAIRAGIGKQKEIFSIFDKGGIAIRLHYSIGGTLGLLKPIYYEVVDSSKIYDNYEVLYISDKQFDYNIHQISDIYSRSSFFKGINETKIVPGAYFKAGMSFVFSEKQEAINALEVGAICDVFTKPIQIMATESKNRYIISLYVGYRFGRIKVKNRDSKQLIETGNETSD